MLGTFRFFLALLVVLSHAGVRWAELNPGVIAVVGFYAISGYVMTGLMRRYYNRVGLIGRFYADRALRLLPAYYVTALLTAALFAWRGPLPPFLDRIPGLADALNNLLVIPLNFFMWNGSDKFVLVPPAWSLGCEMLFYLAFPFLLLLGVRRLFFGLSLAIFLAAFAGWLQTEWFGYRLLPGVLFIFLLGSTLYDCHQAGAEGRRRSRWIASATVASVLALLLAGRWSGILSFPYNPETLVGLAVAIPVLHFLGHREGRVWDDKAGDLSYGLFLVHFLVFWLWPGAESGYAALALRVMAAAALVWGLHRFVEAPVLAWRRRLRQQASTTTTTH